MLRGQVQTRWLRLSENLPPELDDLLLDIFIQTFDWFDAFAEAMNDIIGRSIPTARTRYHALWYAFLARSLGEPDLEVTDGAGKPVRWRQTGETCINFFPV